MSKFEELYNKLVDAWVGQRIKDQENYPEHAHTFDQHFGVGSFASHLMGPLGGYEVRDLSEANVGSTYVITEMCEIQTLVDRGVLPGVEVTVTNRLHDLVMIKIPGSGYVALRGETAKCVKVNKV
jgi:Fe2+ transport system protein FeoA